MGTGVRRTRTGRASKAALAALALAVVAAACSPSPEGAPPRAEVRTEDRTPTQPAPDPATPTEDTGPAAPDGTTPTTSPSSGSPVTTTPPAAPSTDPNPAPPTTVAPTVPTTAPPTTAPPTTAPPTTAPPTTAPPTTAPPTTQPPAGARDARQWPFSSSSPWNMPIGSGAQFTSASDQRTTDLRAPWVAINAATWSMATYTASDTDPLRTVTSYAGTRQYRIPNNAVPSGPSDGDRHLLVIDPTGQYVDECWLASKQANGDWWCDYHVRNDLRGSGVGAGGVRAYGGSALGGLIRTWEIQQGKVQHALALAMPRRYLKHGPVWPATSEDGNAVYQGSLNMGTLVAIPKTVDLSTLGLSSGGMVIARALRDYGAYIVDASENFTLYAEPSAESLLNSARADLEKIRQALRIVTNSSASSVGGGGTPIAPTAPSLG